MLRAIRLFQSIIFSAWFCTVSALHGNGLAPDSTAITAALAYYIAMSAMNDRWPRAIEVTANPDSRCSRIAFAAVAAVTFFVTAFMVFATLEFIVVDASFLAHWSVIGALHGAFAVLLYMPTVLISYRGQ